MSGAFLQGRPFQDDIYMEPLKPWNPGGQHYTPGEGSSMTKRLLLENAGRVWALTDWNHRGKIILELFVALPRKFTLELGCRVFDGHSAVAS